MSVPWDAEVNVFGITEANDVKIKQLNKSVIFIYNWFRFIPLSPFYVTFNKKIIVINI